MASQIDRRQFLAFAGAASLATLHGKLAFSQPPGAHVRYDARSPEGIEMLKIYASAIKKMKDSAQIPPGSPRSWLFQWYTHYVDGATTKETEIARLYPDPADPNRAAAAAMWNTCQAHDGQDEDYFLPWHRCYVYYFEQIIRSVTEQPDFTLPYWNYSATDPTVRGIIPPQFRMEGDLVFGSLFNRTRKPKVNAGRPIQEDSQGSDPLNLDALTRTDYSPHGFKQGCNQDIDQGLHGHIHSLISGDMGAVPTAANDPIFWLHHCNIDRLWASWNAAGRINPTLSQKFTFADKDGKPVDADIVSFLDIGKLDYTYDRFEPVPGAAPRPVLMAAAPVSERIAISGNQGSVNLSGAVTTVPLTPMRPVFGAAGAQGPDANVEAAHVADRVARIAPEESIYLVASQLSAQAQPGVLYNLYLNLPANPNPEQLDDHFVGIINFFGALPHRGNHAPGIVMPGAPMSSKFVSFDVTGKVRALGRNRVLGQKPALSIIAQGNPRPEAQPVIGRVELVVQ